MPKVNTVLGPVDSKELGFTLMHEHVVAVSDSMRKNFSKWIDRDDVIKRSVEAVLQAKKLGVNTIVDATPINLGRDISIIQEVSKRSGVNFIVSTGLYWTDDPWMYAWDPKDIADILIKEITDGIEGSDCKANIIKAGTELCGVTTLNHKVLQTASYLHLKTGLPITTHTAAKQEVGLLQLSVFESMGVDLSRVIIGHCGDSSNISYLEKILQKGCYIGLDRFGIEDFLSSELRMQVVIELCEKGYENQIVLSHDYCSFIDFAPDRVIQKIYPKWHYKYLCETIIPELKKRGLSDKKIEIMTINNPKKIFEMN
jgi:phosphotriesterase-related protein